MISTALQSDLDAIRAAAAPELGDLYLMEASDLPSVVTAAAGDCLGWAQNALSSFGFAGVLGDRWRGPRPTIVLDTEAITAAAACTEAVPGCVRSVFCHELAHCLPAKKLPAALDQMPSSNGCEAALQHMVASLAKPDPTPGTPSDYHDWRFCRRALHIYVRATLTGITVPLWGLFGQGYYWLTDATHFLPLILREAVEMRDATFAQIESTPAPPEFVKMWQLDINHHQQRLAGK